MAGLYTLGCARRREGSGYRSGGGGGRQESDAEDRDACWKWRLGSAKCQDIVTRAISGKRRAVDGRHLQNIHSQSTLLHSTSLSIIQHLASATSYQTLLKLRFLPKVRALTRHLEMLPLALVPFRRRGIGMEFVLGVVGFEDVVDDRRGLGHVSDLPDSQKYRDNEKIALPPRV